MQSAAQSTNQSTTQWNNSHELFTQLSLNQTKTNTISNLNKLGIDHNKFINELKKYNGVISGSFMFMNLKNTSMKCNDIDVYVSDPGYMERYKSSYLEFYHPFEKYILE